MTEQSLLNIINAFCLRHGLSRSAFGQLAIGDASLVHDMATRGRQPRGATQVKITDFMQAHEDKQKEVDLSALWLIRQSGFITLDKGEPCLEGNTQIDKTVFDRLLSDGRIEPSGDALFGVQSQTFKAVGQLNGQG